jgi:2-desacetyl-2-hydroxyethyl bacteriochlorophyllide A dehydrogenase
MKAAVLHGVRDVRFEEVARPELAEGEALLRVRACGICGSDLHTYREGLFLELGLPTQTGRILGHEFAGEIAEINGHIEGFEVGDRVTTAAMGANAEFLKITPQAARLLLPVADDVSFVEAATTEPLATSLHAVNLADIKDDETIVIMGAGIIGLGILQCIKARSSARTIVVDLSEKRLSLATELGADKTVNARDGGVQESLLQDSGEAAGLLGAPAGVANTVFDCVGATRNSKGLSVLEQALAMVKPNGRVVVVAVFEKPLEIDPNIIVRKGVQLIGSWAWVPEEFAEALRLISTGEIDRKPLISHEFSLEEAAEAYATQASTDTAIKVMLVPS